MKIMQIIGILGILSMLLVGCNAKAAALKPVEQPTMIVTIENTQTENTAAQKYCLLTATDKEGAEYMMIDNLFQTKIACEKIDDCYQYLLNSDDYRSMVPDVEKYLDCE